MMPLNLLKLFDRRRADHAVIATFDLDPVFFERRLLRTQALAAPAVSWCSWTLAATARC